jgi:hypothetical protein
MRKVLSVLKAVGLWILQGLIGAALIAFFVFMFLEWAAGCGESYTDSKGKVHITECLWVSHVPSQQVSKP